MQLRGEEKRGDCGGVGRGEELRLLFGGVVLGGRGGEEGAGSLGGFLVGPWEFSLFLCVELAPSGGHR